MYISTLTFTTLLLLTLRGSTALTPTLLQGPVAVAISRTGQRTTFAMDGLQRMLSSLVTSGGVGLPPEYRDIVLLQSTGKRFTRMVAADVSLEQTPAGSHVVRCLPHTT